MKIICVGRNYAAHARELKNDIPSEPVIFLKPDTALLPGRNPFFLPDFSNDIHHELELVVRISRLGKNIEERFAHRYYREVSVGIDFTARDIQADCKSKGLPWEIAKAFDGSAPVGKMTGLEGLDVQDLEITLEKNGTVVQSVNTRHMLFTVNTIITYVSRFFTLKIGDLIFTGTPAGVGPVKRGDELVAKLNGKTLLKVPVR